MNGILNKQSTKELLRFSAELAGIANLATHNELKEFLVILRVERKTTAHHLVHDDADAPPVNRTTVVIVLENLECAKCHKNKKGLTSGAKYSGVPQKVLVLSPKLISSLHKPKSAILM